MSTGIGWTHDTCNPGIYGCEEEGPECANCYAAVMAERLVRMGKYPAGITEKRGSGTHWSRRVFVQYEDIAPRFANVCTKRKPKRIFVTSMADVFHPAVPFDFMDLVFQEMERRPHITFQLLTKRPGRMLEFALQLGRPWPSNVWAGTTCGTAKRIDRVEQLVQVPAAVRFVSVEPLLDDVAPALEPYLGACRCMVPWLEGAGMHAPSCPATRPRPVSQVIVGGESGKRARPNQLAWFRNLVHITRDAGTALFVKQMGAIYARSTYVDGRSIWSTGDRAAEQLEHIPADLRFREFPERAAA